MLADELDTAGYYDPDEMNKVAEAYMAGLSSGGYVGPQISS